MSTLETVLRFVAGIGLLAGNAFFVGTEFAMTRVRQFDESEFEGSAGLRRAWEMTKELEIYLTGCQVGITICSILLGVVFEPAISAIVDPLIHSLGIPFLDRTVVAIVISVAIIQLLHTVWGEQTPTYFGVEAPKTVATYFAIPLYWWTQLTYPLIYVGDHLAKATLGLFGLEISRSWTEGEGEPGEATSRGELRRQMGELLRGRLSKEQREEVINALEIVDTPTEEIAVPRDEVIALSTEHSPAENYELMCETHHSRYPLVGESIEDFVGIVYSPALFPVIDAIRSGDVSFQEIAVEPMTVAHDCSVSSLIDQFQRQHQELALVERDGTIIGLVTATDAFEEVTGELEDPFD